MNERSTDYEGRLVETVDDHGNGWATRTRYAPDGTVTSVERIEVPLPEE